MSECERKDKWIRGCKFEPRYDKSPAQYGRVSAPNPEFLEKLRNVTYVKDVCVRCGKTVVR